MSNEGLELTELLGSKKELLSEILRVTGIVNITGELGEYDRELWEYTDLIEKRAPMFEELARLDGLIAGLKAQSADGGTDGQKQEEARILQIAAEIIERDEKNNEVAQKLAGFGRERLKNISMGRSASLKYGDPYGNSDRPSAIDYRN